MKDQKTGWLAWLAGIFHREQAYHRICRKCHKPIKRTHHWHAVKKGRFSSAYCVEHKNCKNPTMETPWQLAQRLGPELPFEEQLTANSRQ
jgi:deoxyribodipyrimidine photolyase